MTDLQQITKKTSRLCVLVTANFVMFLVLFLGIGIVAWQSSRLIGQLRADLERAEQAVASARERIDELTSESLADRLMSRVGDRIGDSLRSVLASSQIGETLRTVSQRMTEAEVRLEETRSSILEIGTSVRNIDADMLAEQVAQRVLDKLAQESASPPDS